MKLNSLLDNFLSKTNNKKISTESLYDIIKEYKNETGFITHIDCLCEDLKEYYNNEEIITILKDIQRKNVELYNKYKDELEKIDGKNYTVSETKLKTTTYSKKINETQKQEEISYNNDLLKLIENITSDKVTNIMPIISKVTDDNSLNTIKCRILEEITLYKKELIIESNKEIIAYYRQQIEVLEEKLNTILNYHASLSAVIKPVKRNHLIFLNNNGKNIFYDELKQIDSDDYEAILNLLNIIINNQTHLFKSFTNNVKFKGLLEVRDLFNKYRVVFKIINNYCVIISTFYKDCDNSTIYRTRLLNKINIFTENIETIEQQLAIDPSVYLETEKEILKYLSNGKERKGIK